MALANSGGGTGDVPADKVSQVVDQQLASLDPQRASALTGLQTARATRAAGYIREQKRLTLKYGADHPRVTALADKIHANDGLRRDVSFEADRASTPAPVVDSTGYVFHGFVRDLAGQGVPQLTIALYDQNGNWISKVGYGCTDERGYFLMQVQRGKNPATDPKTVLGMFAAAPAKSDTSDNPGRDARIYVLNSKKATLQIEPQPLHPQLGQVDFRIIILGGNSPPCTTPPQQPGEPSPAASTPLDNVPGIGPVRLRNLRAAGIKDIETLLKTDDAKIKKLTGLEVAAVKRDAAKMLKKKLRK